VAVLLVDEDEEDRLILLVPERAAAAAATGEGEGCFWRVDNRHLLESASPLIMVLCSSLYRNFFFALYGTVI
jgi:hypothetical protein